MKALLGLIAAAVIVASVQAVPAVVSSPDVGLVTLRQISHSGSDESVVARATDSTGAAVKDTRVALQRKDYSTWDDVVSAVTNDAGDVYFDYLTSTHAQIYRATSGTVASTGVTVRQAALTVPILKLDTASSERSGSKAVLEGSVQYVTYRFSGGQFFGTMRHAVPTGLHIQLQQLISGTWKTVGTAQVQQSKPGQDDVFFAIARPISSWRLHYPGGTVYAPAASPAITK